MPVIDSSNILAGAESAIRAIKELFLVALLVYVAWHLAPIVPKWLKGLDGKTVSEVSVAGFGVKLADIQEKLQESVRDVKPQKTGADEPVQQKQLLVAEAIENLKSLRAEANPPVAPTAVAPANTSSVVAAQAQQTPAGSFWVYLGTSVGDVVSSKTFRQGRMPEPGVIVEAISDVYKRSKQPTPAGDNGWTLGEVTGVIRLGERIEVQQVAQRDSDRPREKIIWLRATRVR